MAGPGTPGLSEMVVTTLRNRQAKGANNMARHVPKTKAGKQAKMHIVMSEFKDRDLHSGSPDGPKVKSRAQAIAIGLNMSGQSNKEHGLRDGAGTPNPLEKYPGHQPGPVGSDGVQGLLKDAGGPTTAETQRAYGSMGEKDHWDRGQPHAYRPASNSHGYGHDVSRRSGALRLSGSPTAHQIGKRAK